MVVLAYRKTFHAAVYFVHNEDAAEVAKSLGFTTYFYDHTEKDLNGLKSFLDESL